MARFNIQQAFDSLKEAVTAGFNEAARQIKALDQKVKKSEQAVTDLQASKADVSHTHTVSEVTGLSAELERYALKTELNNINVDTSDLATKASVDELSEQIVAKADQSELDNLSQSLEQYQNDQAEALQLKADKSALAEYVKKGEITQSTDVDLSDFVTHVDLPEYVNAIAVAFISDQIYQTDSFLMSNIFRSIQRKLFDENSDLPGDIIEVINNQLKKESALTQSVEAVIIDRLDNHGSEIYTVINDLIDQKINQAR